MHDSAMGTWVAIQKIEFDDFTVMGGTRFDVVKELQGGEVLIRKEGNYSARCRRVVQ